MYISEIKLRKIIKEELERKKSYQFSKPSDGVDSMSKKDASQKISNVTQKDKLESRGLIIGSGVQIGSRTTPENAGLLSIGVPKEKILNVYPVVVIRDKNTKFNFTDRDSTFRKLKVEDLKNYQFINKFPGIDRALSAESIIKKAEEGKLAIVPIGKYGATEFTSSIGLGSDIATTILDVASFGLTLTGIGEVIAPGVDLLSAQIKWNSGRKFESWISILAAAPIIGEIFRAIFNILDAMIEASDYLLGNKYTLALIKNLNKIINFIASEDYEERLFKAFKDGGIDLSDNYKSLIKKGRAQNRILLKKLKDMLQKTKEIMKENKINVDTFGIDW